MTSLLGRSVPIIAVSSRRPHLAPWVNRGTSWARKIVSTTSPHRGALRPEHIQTRCFARKSGKNESTSPPGPAPPAPTTAPGAAEKEVWQEVKDPNGSGQTYFWNPESNQTTALGAPKPNSVAGAAPAPPPASGAARGGLMGAVAEGMAWGVGSSMAHRMMDGVLGPRSMDVVHRNEGEGSAGAAEEPPPDSGDSEWFSDDNEWFN